MKFFLKSSDIQSRERTSPQPMPTSSDVKEENVVHKRLNKICCGQHSKKVTLMASPQALVIGFDPQKKWSSIPHNFDIHIQRDLDQRLVEIL